MNEKKVSEILVAVAGNPNSGKTSLFNSLTGSHQHVGNYPGVTVETKEGETTFNGMRIHFIDLPGTYSLTSYSQEEVIAKAQDPTTVLQKLQELEEVDLGIIILARLINNTTPITTPIEPTPEVNKCATDVYECRNKEECD